MDAEPLYCAEQIYVPPEMPNVLKQWTIECIRAQPTDIISWSAQYVSSAGAHDRASAAQRVRLTLCLDADPTRRYFQGLSAAHQPSTDELSDEDSKSKK